MACVDAGKSLTAPSSDWLNLSNFRHLANDYNGNSIKCVYPFILVMFIFVYARWHVSMFGALHAKITGRSEQKPSHTTLSTRTTAAAAIHLIRMRFQFACKMNE